LFRCQTWRRCSQKLMFRRIRSRDTARVVSNKHRCLIENDRSRTSSHGWRRLARVIKEDVVLKHMLLPSQLLSSIVSHDLTYMPRTRLVRCRRHVPFHSKSRQTRYTYAGNANLHNTLAVHVSPRYSSIGMAQQPTFHVVVTSLAILLGKPLNAIQVILRPVSRDKRPTPSKA
jgi:hypothetical protein